MVFVWSNLTKGEPHFTLSQVALNDAVMVVAFAPIVAMLLGLSAIIVPWDTLALSVVLYIVIPVILSQVLRRNLLASGSARFDAFLARIQPLSLIALLATLVLLFAFQVSRFSPSRWSSRFLRCRSSSRPTSSSAPPTCSTASPARHIALPAVGADRGLQLLRTRRRGGDQPLRLPVRGRAGHRGGRADRVPVMLTLVKIVNGIQGWYERGALVKSASAVQSSTERA